MSSRSVCTGESDCETSACVVLFIFLSLFEVDAYISECLREINHNYNLINFRFDDTFLIVNYAVFTEHIFQVIIIS